MQNLKEIEGIGEVYSRKLEEIGILTAKDLLSRGGAAEGRKEMAADAGISLRLISKWVNQARLLRINGIGGEYADLLESAGVESVTELAKCEPESLHRKLAVVNRDNKLVRRLPSISQVSDWIEQAKHFVFPVEEEPEVKEPPGIRVWIRSGGKKIQSRNVPSMLMINLGTLFFCLVGILLLAQLLQSQSVTFTTDAEYWPEGESPSGRSSQSFLEGGRIYETTLYTGSVFGDSVLERELPSGRGLCLSVEAKIVQGLPAEYGVILFHANEPEQRSLRFGINEEEETVYWFQVNNEETSPIDIRESIGNALSDVPQDEWHSIHLSILSNEIKAWLNGHYVSTFYDVPMREGRIGLFVHARSTSVGGESLATRVQFKNFSVRLLLPWEECEP